MIHTKRKTVQVYRLMNDVLLLLSFFFSSCFFLSIPTSCMLQSSSLFFFFFSNFPLFLVGYKVKADSFSINVWSEPKSPRGRNCQEKGRVFEQCRD